MADFSCDHLTVKTISAPSGQAVRLLTTMGFVEFSANEIRIVSTTQDPPGICLEAMEGGSLGKVSMSRARSDGLREEVVLLQGKIDERNRAGLGGEFTMHIRRDGVHDGDKAMERVQAFNVDGPIGGPAPPQPPSQPPTEPPPTQPPPSGNHGIPDGDFNAVYRYYGFPSDDQQDYSAGKMTWAAVIARMDVEGRVIRALLVLLVLALATSAQAQVTIPAGDDIQTAVNANGAGTTYTLGTGFHRMQVVTPKTGDTFQGVAGTILSGARVLSSWTADSGRWYATGQTQEGTATISPGSCLASHPRCNNPEDLFFDNVLQYHEDALADVGAGEWFFDYAADRIYVGSDPAGHTVETSVVPRPFLQGSATGVTIRDMVVEKWAAPTGDGAIGLWTGWLATGLTCRWNHGGCIYQVDNSSATNNVVTENCGMAMQGAGSNILVFQNEISYNAGTATTPSCGYDPYWGSGGSKWVFTVDLVVRGNYVHDNYGPGLWTDISNLRTLYEGNLLTFNRRSGIFHEISYAAIIRGNTGFQNGIDTTFGDYPTNGCIEVTSSPNVEVYNNTCTDNYNGIVALDDNRNGTGGEFNIVNLHVHDNLIDQRNISATTGFNGLLDFEDNSPTGPAYQAAANNRWLNNRYCPSVDTTPFYWDGALMTPVQWAGQGNDVTTATVVCNAGGGIVRHRRIRRAP